MLLSSGKLTLAFAAVSLALVGAERAQAQYPPTVAYYAPAPVVTCYSAPVVYTGAVQASYYYAPAVSYYAPQVAYSPPSPSYYAPTASYYAAPTVSYYAAPTVSYYAAPTVSYYAPPTVSYYAPASAVTTTRYGLLGRPRATTAYYYP